MGSAIKAGAKEITLDNAKIDSAQDSLFKFMNGLKPGLDTIVNFAYLGNHQTGLV